MQIIGLLRINAKAKTLRTVVQCNPHSLFFPNNNSPANTGICKYNWAFRYTSCLTNVNLPFSADFYSGKEGILSGVPKSSCLWMAKSVSPSGLILTRGPAITWIIELLSGLRASVCLVLKNICVFGSITLSRGYYQNMCAVLNSWGNKSCWNHRNIAANMGKKDCSFHATCRDKSEFSITGRILIFASGSDG